MAKANLTCPFCDKEQDVEIPTDACLAFHKCEQCGKVIAPKAGECCVVCSWSDERCPTSTKA